MNNAIKNAVLTTANVLTWLPPLATRIAVGLIFIQAGWGKINHMANTIDFFKQLGIPAAHLQAPFVAWVEFLCGILVLAGLFTRLAVIPLAATMIVAILTAKLPEIKTISDLWMVPDFLLILLFAWLFVRGPGAVSADNFICKDCAGTKKA